MSRAHALVGMLALALLLVGCEQISIAEQERIRNVQTVEASTPSATPTASSTPTPPPSATPTATTGPSPTPSATPVPSPTPLPPTPTPNPALAGFSLCNQTAGDPLGGRFSAGVAGISTTVEADFERLVVALDVPPESAPPHASARCRPSPALPPAVGQPEVAGAYLIEVDLGGWLRDEAFRAALASPSLPLSGTTAIRGAAFRADPGAATGATLAIGVDQPLPYRVRIERDPYRLIVEVAESPQLGAASDMLRVESGGARPADPLIYLQGGDVWRLDGAAPRNLTADVRGDQFGDVSSLTVSRRSGRVAFCATAPGATAADVLAPGGLWTMALDGSDLRLLAAPGRSCVDPAFSPDGTTVAFAVDETGAFPPRLAIYLVEIFEGAAEVRLSRVGDEWSRFGPQWLDDGRMVYTAQSEDGRSTLFMRFADGTEEDIGASLLVSGGPGQSRARYRGFGRLVTAPGAAIAVEALRVDQPGADLLVLDVNGREVQSGSPVAGGYWTRPLAWAPDGTLYYLTTACAGEVVQEYTLYARAPGGSERAIAFGSTTGAFGSFSALPGGLAYVTLDQAAPGPRGPLAVEPGSPAAIWYWNVDGGGRSRLVETERAIGALAP